MSSSTLLSNAHNPYMVTQQTHQPVPQKHTSEQNRTMPRGCCIAWDHPYLEGHQLTDFTSLVYPDDHRKLFEGLTIQPLDQQHSKSAQEAVKQIFPDDAAHIELEYALQDQAHVDFDSDMVILFAEYWVVVEQSTHKVAAVLGYRKLLQDSHEALWPHWWGVHPDFRGLGIGVGLGIFFCAKVIDSGIRFGRLYSEDLEFEKKAVQMYRRAGIRIVRREENPQEQYNRLYLEAKLYGWRRPIYKAILLTSKCLYFLSRQQKRIRRRFANS